MSSVLATTISAPGSKSSQETKFRNITTPSYFDLNYGSYLPIPFSYSNGTLDINNQDAVTFYTDNGFLPEVYSYSKVRQMGGTGLVQSLGPTMTSWLQEIFDNEMGGATATPKITQPAQVSRAQVLNKNITFDSFPYLYNGEMTQFLPGLPAYLDTANYGGISFTNDSGIDPPADNFLYTGDANDNFGSVVIFQSPLAVSVSNGSDTMKMIFTTQFENNYPAASYGSDLDWWYYNY